MESVILNSIACSTILIMVYYMILTNEKTLSFNRFYLLFSLVFAYTVPFLKVSWPTLAEKKLREQSSPIVLDPVILNGNQYENPFNWSSLLLYIYFIGVAIQLTKAVLSILKIKRLKGQKAKIEGQKVKIVNDKIPVFSFFGTIYLSKNHIAQGKIDDRIVQHERKHITQLHVLDLMLVEFLHIISWFNPALYFYKKAIIANHEFLADQGVLSQNYDARSYQKLILQEICSEQNIDFTHQFNFYNTKKRFIMMTKHKSKIATLKKTIAVPLFFVLFILFVQKINANHRVTKKETIAIEETRDQNFTEKVKRSTPENAPVKQQEQLLAVQKTTEKAAQFTKESPIISDTVRKKEQGTPQKEAPLSQSLQHAEFPEGNSHLRMKIAQNFDSSKFLNEQGKLEAVILFVVDENGNTTDFKVEGKNQKFNDAALDAFKKTVDNEKWKPATRNGTPEKQHMKMPFQITFSNT